MIPAERAHLYVAANSHPGMSGKSNEDRFAVSAFQVAAQDPLPALLAVVADGIGGHRAGEVAAEIAVERISQVVAASDAAHPLETLENAISQASQAILAQAETHAEQTGMGATCACCWILGDRLYTANVGDSRIYLARKEQITQLSTDHTWIQEAIDRRVLDPAQARHHPNAHVLRRYLGARLGVKPDLRLRLRPGESDAQARANQGLKLLPGDQVLLCSDGLTDLVEPDEILTILKLHDLAEAVQALINLANRRGGHDNITLVGLQAPETWPETIPAGPARRERRTGVPGSARSWAFAGISALLVAGVAAILGGLFWWNSLRPPATPTPLRPLPGVYLPTNPAPGATTSPGAARTATPLTAPATLTASPHAARPAATLTPWPTNTLAP